MFERMIHLTRSCAGGVVSTRRGERGGARDGGGGGLGLRGRGRDGRN